MSNKSFFNTCPMVYIPTVSFLGVMIYSIYSKSKGSRTKKFDLSAAARKNILDLQPYRCARDDYSEVFH